MSITICRRRFPEDHARIAKCYRSSIFCYNKAAQRAFASADLPEKTAEQA